MLGKDLYKVELNIDISPMRQRSLILFYGPLIGEKALYLYEYFASVQRNSFEELNNLLLILNYTVDEFEKASKKLNEYRLLKTLKKKNEDSYIFVLNNPLSIKEFIKDDLFIRNFILKTSGSYYQNLISELRYYDKHNDYEDVSAKYSGEELNSWNEDNEAIFQKSNVKKDTYRFDTLFDINIFLKDMSDNLFPLRYRTFENLSEIAKLADLYNISYEKMRRFIPEVYKTGDTKFDLKLLRYKCQNAVPDYKYVENGIYDVPCLLFLMNKQEGKELTPYDKNLIYRLANEYKLKPAVINVLIEHTLKNCNNRLLESYINPIASDLHRNNIESAKEAIDRLDRYKSVSKESDIVEEYDSSNNPKFTEERRQALMERRSQND